MTLSSSSYVGNVQYIEIKSGPNVLVSTSFSHGRHSSTEGMKSKTLGDIYYFLDVEIQ